MASEKQVGWHEVVEGDQVKSVRNGRFYPVVATAKVGGSIHVTLDLDGKHKTVIRPTPAEPKATVRRGATGQAVDVFIEVFSSR